MGSHHKSGRFIALLKAFGTQESILAIKVHGQLRYSCDSLSRVLGLRSQRGLLMARGKSVSFCSAVVSKFLNVSLGGRCGNVPESVVVLSLWRSVIGSGLGAISW